MYHSLPLIISFLGGVLSSSLFTPCKISDPTCIEKSVNAALPKIFDGIPELGVKSSDPQFDDIVEVDVPMLKVTLFNSTLVGYKKCTLSNIKFNDDITKIHCNALCEAFNMTGKYEMKGYLIAIPIEGRGDFQFLTGKFLVSVDTKVEKVKGNDGKTHIVIKDYKIVSKPLTPILFDFQNLFNGEKDLAEAVHKFSRENWSEVAKLVQYPIWYKSLDTIVENLNTYLDTVAMEDMFIN